MACHIFYFYRCGRCYYDDLRADETILIQLLQHTCTGGRTLKGDVKHNRISPELELPQTDVPLCNSTTDHKCLGNIQFF